MKAIATIVSHPDGKQSVVGGKVPSDILKRHMYGAKLFNKILTGSYLVGNGQFMVVQTGRKNP